MHVFKRTSIAAALFLYGMVSAATPQTKSTEGDVPESVSAGFSLSLSGDIPLTLAAAGISGLGSLLYSQMKVPDETKGKDDLLPWDRPIAGRYSRTADRISDFGAALAVAPVTVGAVAWYQGRSNAAEFATFTLMFAQAIAIGNGINLAVRSLEIWPRPYTYAESGEGLHAAENAKPEAYGSFFSGHATAAFTVATFTDQWFRTVYPNSPYAGIVRAGAYSLAAIESMMRVTAGKHYFTDVIVGALVGTGVSLGILEIHRNRNEKFSMWIGTNVVGITSRF